MDFDLDMLIDLDVEEGLLHGMTHQQAVDQAFKNLPGYIKSMNEEREQREENLQ